jgi:Mg-chelatase subunit ChlI
MISEICSRCDVDGLRGDLVTNRAAAAYVALNGRTEVTVEDVGAVVSMTLAHRMRKDVMDGMDNTGKVKSVFRRVTDPEVREREDAAEKAREEAKAAAKDAAAGGDKRAGKKAGAWGGL